MASRAYDFSIGDSNIDSETSTISKVSLISIGQAKGHQLDSGEQIWVDGKTLDQIYSCLVEMGTLKLKVDHGSGVMSTAGWIDGFEKKGSKIIGDMHVYDAEPEKLRMFEIAEKNPDHLGLSLEFSGDDEVLGNKAFARCDEVSAVALVSEPAANSSLFEKSTKSVDSTNKNGNTKNMATKKNLDAAEAPGDPIAEMSKKFGEFCTRYEADQADRDAKMKKFDDYLNNNDGKAAISGEGRNIDPNVTPVVVNDDKSAESDKEFSDDEKDEDEKDDDKKDDKVNKSALEALENRLTKKFAASLGTKIPIAGTGAGLTAGSASKKNFSEIVEGRTKELKGDKVKAMLECLKEFPAEYAESRKKFLKVEPKATRYL